MNALEPPVTITLPFSVPVLWFLAVMTIVALICLAIIIVQPYFSKETRRAWVGLTSAETAFGVILALLWIGLLILSVGTAYALLLNQGHIGSGINKGGAGVSGLGAGAMMVALLGAPWVIWGTWLKHRAVSFQQEGHITDRINKAVEHLGAEKTVKVIVKGGDAEQTIERTEPNIEMRIGGLLSLQRVAEDSMRYDHGRDHIRVMQIICAYIRQNSPVQKQQPSEEKSIVRRPRIDIQVAIDTLRKRTTEQILIEEVNRYRLDLNTVDLTRLELSNADFSGALLKECTIKGTNITSTDLSGANLSRAELHSAVMHRAALKGVIAHEAQISRNFLRALEHTDQLALDIRVFIHFIPTPILDNDRGVTNPIYDQEAWKRFLRKMSPACFFGDEGTLAQFSDINYQVELAAERYRQLNQVERARIYSHPTALILGDDDELSWYLHWDFAWADLETPGTNPEHRWRDHHKLRGWPFED